MSDTLDILGYESTVAISITPRSLKADVFDPWVTLPRYRPTPAPRSQWLAQDITMATSWSTRTLASILGTSHTTIRALLQGRATGSRNLPELHTRLREVHDVIDRVREIAMHDPSETQRLLTTAPAAGESHALALLQAREPAAAYLAAVDVARPRRTDRLMTGIFPAPAGEATAALTDQE